MIIFIELLYLIDDWLGLDLRKELQTYMRFKKISLHAQIFFFEVFEKKNKKRIFTLIMNRTRMSSKTNEEKCYNSN